MLNIAIYSRKSIFTEKGNSIENQINLCKTYCSTYLDKKSEINYLIYEDEGFSGKNTNRPEFKHLINDIKHNKIHILICYRLDRISRNVADFSSTLELLQKYGVDFISIKERFDTSTPLGRAMIYMASVFAQLERETIAERVRDNMIKLAESGRWLGGNTPYGFNIKRQSYITSDFKEKTLSILTPNDSELKVVKLIYSYYIKKRSIRAVEKYLNSNSIIGKKGGHIDITIIRRILRNPLYVISDSTSHKYLESIGFNVFGIPNGNGYITYNKITSISNTTNCIAAVSNHTGIIPSYEWLNVQSQLDINKSKTPRTGTGKNHSLFSGILKCKKCGSNMVIKFSGYNNNNIPYEYYVCSGKQNKFKAKCTTRNIRVAKLDSIILEKLNLYNKAIILNALKTSLDNFNTNFENQHIINIKSKIKENESLMSNLIKQLSKSTSEFVSNKIMKEINSIDNIIQNLNNELSSLKSSKSLSNTIDHATIKQISNSFSNLNATLNYIEDISQKRLLIHTLIKCVIWDSDNNTVEIILH
ncbi:recombinase family protein [Clostridium sp. SM-530-WT-3G]|uniref:recombinase family protein n=1 Tax=Clostridium sp. SM-530-WT-3G TaxID=2725303 RepID=UPI00145F431A|nr:recombinase family protein [Clostridium sp. SM-530-WT-3G]NME84094.1 recombinase family protein [Clostridium sp. SM-530-WT-3G]